MEDFEGISFPEREVGGKIFLEVCKVDEIPKKRGKVIFFDEETQIAIFLSEGTLHAISNICPHQHSAVLFDGFVEDCTITCPLHGWIYSLENGRALGGGAKLKIYEVFEENGFVFIEKPEKVEPTWANW